MSKAKIPDRPHADPDYEVGYGKPPRRTRFQPGQSGNPRGRGKGTKNLKTDLREELAEKIVVREGEHARTMSKQRALIKTLVAKTLKGDIRAGSMVINLMTRLLDTGAGATAVDVHLDADELAIFDDYLERRSRQRAHGSPAEAGSESDALEESTPAEKPVPDDSEDS